VSFSCHLTLQFLSHSITACTSAQCNAMQKDNFSTKGKTLIFDCSPTLRPITPNLAKLITLMSSIGVSNFIAISWETAPPRTGEIKHQCAILMFLYIFWFTGLYICFPQVNSPNCASDFNALWLRRRGLVQGSAGVWMMAMYLFWGSAAQKTLIFWCQ